MLDTNILIKNVAFDIISVITIWGLLNNSYLNLNINNKIYPLSTKLIGICFSIFIIKKYI
jgi:hypothetical protein